MGELLALLSAFFFAFSGATIAKGAPAARGDNGAFLSIVLTGAMALSIWVISGASVTLSENGSFSIAILWFVVAGMLSIVLGRTATFRAIALSGVIAASLLRRLAPVFGAILAYFLLGETVGLIAGVGIGVIVGSLVLVARQDFKKVAGINSAKVGASSVSLGHAYGFAAAACYGSTYVGRKLGLAQLPDPAFGGAIGALTGLVWYALAIPFSQTHRAAVTGLISTTGKWQFMAALSMSAGQVSLFFALNYTTVTTVAIIGGMDIFIGAWLAAFVFRTEPPPSLSVTLGTILATIGVILVALD